MPIVPQRAQAAILAGKPSLSLARFSRFTVAATFVLLMAGASVTSTGSGLAVPDWPLSYGTLFPPMVGGVVFEHGHRMIAAVVALLIFLLAGCLARSHDPPPLARRLALAAAALVIVQALLGGLTVLFLLPPVISVAHAMLALAVFGLVFAVAVLSSLGWRRPATGADSPRVRSVSLAALAALALQILLGAVVRHVGAGLACPDFPLCHGKLWPPLDHPWVQLHFAHRLGALVVTGLVVALLAAASRGSSPRVRAGAWAALGLVLVQIALGGASVLSGLAAPFTVAHHAVGVLLLSALLWVVLWSHHAGEAAPAASSLERAAELPA